MVQTIHRCGEFSRDRFGLAFVMAYVLKWSPIVSLALAALAGFLLHLAA